MTPVFAQVQRNGVGTGLLGFDGRLHRVGIARTARLAQRRHVININSQFNHVVPLLEGRPLPDAGRSRRPASRDTSASLRVEITHGSWAADRRDGAPAPGPS